MAILDEVKRLCRIVGLSGGTSFVVGGASRDFVRTGSMDNVKDFDIEVFGLSPEELQNKLSFYYPIDLVGESFGVIKIKGLPIDVSIPRRESKIGVGHTGFQILSDPNLSVEEAALRRDFTINAIYYDIVHGGLTDPYGGAMDIAKGILKPVSERFKEDPLRVLRAMQFIARFNMRPADELISMSKEVVITGLSKERIYGEWEKLMLKGDRISAALDFLVACGWINYFPELANLQTIQQDPEWHPEGNVFIHTGHVLDAFAKERAGNDEEDLVMGFACLTHDFGKVTTTTKESGRWTSPGHEEAGVPLAKAFMRRMTDSDKIINQVLPLVAHHLRPRLLYDGNAKDSAIRRLALKIDGRFDRLTKLNKLDQLGRPPLNPTEFPENDWLITKAANLSINDEAPKPIVMGRHLIHLGVAPGKHMQGLLNTCFEAQLEGIITDEANGLEFAKQLITPVNVELVPAEDLTDG